MSTNRSWFKYYPKWTKHEIDISETSCLAEAFERAAAKYSDNPALSCLGTTISYRDLNRAATRLAGYLQGIIHLSKGDRLAILMPNIIQFPIALFAAQKIGVVPVLVNPLYTPREILHVLKDSEARALIAMDSFLYKVEEIIHDTKLERIISTTIGAQLPVWKGFFIDSVLRLQGFAPKHGLEIISLDEAIKQGAEIGYRPIEIRHDDMCFLQYTGGTTGTSKGAVLLQRNILANIAMIDAWSHDLLQQGKEVILTPLPLFHIFSLVVNLLTFITNGHHIILIPKPVPIKNTIKGFKKYRVSVMTGVTTLYNALVRNEQFQKIAPKTIKFALEGGMPLQESVANMWYEITGNKLIEGFGMTEASPVTHANPLVGEQRIGSIGVPFPSTDAKIVDEQGRELPDSEVGEMLVRGPQVMKEYWKAEEETKRVLQNGWLRTGDMAKRDEDGFFYIVDRKKDMILVSGFNVFPNEVDSVLMDHPKVKEAAVVGIPDESCGEAIKAYVVPADPALDVKELQEHCREFLTNYKRPKYYEFSDSLPKTTVGKVLRRALR